MKSLIYINGSRIRKAGFYLIFPQIYVCFDLTEFELQRYLETKENSALTYSHLFFMLQYLLNKAYYKQTFLTDLNTFLSENDFKYKFKYTFYTDNRKRTFYNK